jgi:Short C-terminal domain
MSPLLRRRRPLLRTAAVGGGAYLMGKRRAEATQLAGPAEPAQSAEPAPSESADVPIERLKQLGELHDSGVLTDEEFAAQKARLLG